MLSRTHLTITLFFVLSLFSIVEHKITFVLVALIATYLPDLDSPRSKFGDKFILRPIQLFLKHRGVLHSFTFLSLITLFFVLFVPTFSLPFFLGYSLHILADSFTVEGVYPFYPLKKISRGSVRTGGKRDTIVFVVFLIL